MFPVLTGTIAVSVVWGEEHQPDTCSHCKKLCKPTLKSRAQRLKAFLWKKPLYPTVPTMEQDPSLTPTHPPAQDMAPSLPSLPTNSSSKSPTKCLKKSSKKSQVGQSAKRPSSDELRKKKTIDESNKGKKDKTSKDK